MCPGNCGILHGELFQVAKELKAGHETNLQWFVQSLTRTLGGTAQQEYALLG